MNLKGIVPARHCKAIVETYKKSFIAMRPAAYSWYIP